jgi:hypothetical protein
MDSEPVNARYVQDSTFISAQATFGHKLMVCQSASLSGELFGYNLQAFCRNKVVRNSADAEKSQELHYEDA